MGRLEGQPAQPPEAKSVLGRWWRRVLSAVRTLLLGALKGLRGSQDEVLPGVSEWFGELAVLILIPTVGWFIRYRREQRKSAADG